MITAAMGALVLLGLFVLAMAVEKSVRIFHWVRELAREAERLEDPGEY